MPKAHRCEFVFHRTLKHRGETGPWTLWRCRFCNWTKLGETPLLKEAYPEEYYGSGHRKFVRGVEWISTLPPPGFRGIVRKITFYTKREMRTPTVLDIGCGRGYLLKRLDELGWNCAGLDIPLSPIPRDTPNIDFRIGSADQPLPWPNEAFDLVVLNHALEHTANPHFVIKEASRVLRLGGYVYVGVPNFNSWQAKCFGDFWFPLEIPRHLHHFEPGSLKLLLKENGLEIEHLSTRSLRQAVFGFIQSVLNSVDQDHPDLLLGFIKGRKPGSFLRSIFHLLAGLFLTPIALWEGLLSPCWQQGSTVVTVAQKRVASLSSLVN